MCACVCVCVCVCTSDMYNSKEKFFSPHNSLCCADGDISVGLHAIAVTVTAVVTGPPMNEFSFKVAHWEKAMGANLSRGAL